MARVPLPVLSCDDCGACCRLHVRPPFLPQELDVAPRELVRDIEGRCGAGDGGLDEAGPCIWLTAAGRCAHYDDRPALCREFERGGEDCRLLRAERGIGQAGPGRSDGARRAVY